MLFLLLLFLSSAAIYENTELIVISPPFSVNASLGSTAEFNCTCHYCVGQFWLVNGVSANYQVNYNKGVRPTMSSNNGNNRSYTLTMPASVQLNGSTIECVAYNESSQSTSAAKLLVQGLLSEVANVAITQFNSTTLILQYAAPFTLAGIPILYYNILILPTNLSVNITDTQFHLHISEYCISYNISITPWNIVGMGNATTLSDIVIHQVPAITMPQLIQEYKGNSETLHVYYEVQYNTSCKGTVPQSVSLTINQEKDHYCSLVSPAANNCTITTADIDNNANVTINITEVLGYGANYVINMSLLNANNIKTEDFIFNISTYHVIAAAITTVNDTTVCLECIFRHNSPSAGCYAVFHPINTTGGDSRLMYYKIMKPPADSASGCISTLPNGVYSISVLDALSYEEGKFNNTAIDILLLITINNTMFVIPSTTSMTTRSIISFKIPSRSMTTTNENSWTSFIPSPLLITSSSYDDNISMATSGPPVLIVALTGSAAFMMIMITIVVIISVGLCVAKKRKRSIAIHGIKKDGNATPCHTPVTNRFMVKEGIQCKTTFNEAYDNVTQANVVYETIPEKVQYVSGSAAGGLQINVAYDCIGGLRANH